MGRAITFAFMIFSFNIALMLVNSIDGVNVQETGHSLFGVRVDPYVSYANMPDSAGVSVNFSNKDSMENATDRAISFDVAGNQYFDLGLWTTLKSFVSIIVNFLYRGFFGLPAFLYEHFSMPLIFVGPLYIAIGVIQFIGIYEIVRGGTL